MAITAIMDILQKKNNGQLGVIMKDIFIVGSKGIPANYGGFETFVDNLVSKRKNNNLKYHVSCMKLSNSVKNYSYNDAECQEIYVPDIGGAKAILYDVRSLKWVLDTIEKKGYRDGIVYILACRIGPFLKNYVKKFHKFGFQVWVNPDGHEWKRAKWSKLVRRYWKYSESLMVKWSDYLICDSKSIEKYICHEYKKFKPQTTFIAYGSDTSFSNLSRGSENVDTWYKKNELQENEYFLVVGRFVPENNYETIIKEYMKCSTNKDLVIITNIEHNNFYDSLKKSTGFDEDKRIKFVGTVYDTDLLKYIRENAFAYIHGHSVGGTNPSLLEALGSTKINLLYDVGFNREVAGDAALYWTKENNSLKDVFDKIKLLSPKEILHLSQKSRQRIEDFYSWDRIVGQYETKFLIRRKND